MLFIPIIILSFNITFPTTKLQVPCPYPPLWLIFCLAVFLIYGFRKELSGISSFLLQYFISSFIFISLYSCRQTLILFFEIWSEFTNQYMEKFIIFGSEFDIFIM